MRREERMKLAIDHEGTLSDPHTLYLEVYNQKNGTNYTLEDIPYWDFIGSPIDKEHFVETSKQLWKSDIEIPPIEPFLKKYLDNLTDYHQIDIVTARLECDEELKKWLDDYDISYDKFIVEEDKNKLNYDIYIDDNPRLDSESLILFSRPWNRNGEGLIRLEDEVDLQYWLGDPELTLLRSRLSGLEKAIS